MKLSKPMHDVLSLFGPSTYSIKLPRTPARISLEELGLIEWVPSWMPGGSDA